MSREELEAIKGRLANRGPGGWSVSRCACGHRSCKSFVLNFAGPEGRLGQGDADFIAHAPADVAALMAEVERLGESLADVLAAANNLNRWQRGTGKDWEAFREALERNPSPY